MSNSDTVAPHPLAEFIRVLADRPIHIQERNLFSLGARGHYENPTSDLLAFFLQPHEEHQFGSLFLDALLECAESKMSVSGYIAVTREQQTEDGKRIDLEISGEQALILMENKIYSGQGNPFESYETFATTHLNGRELLLIVLSPDGTSARNGWRGVSYKTYCAKLRDRLSAAHWAQQPNKWALFAREFIIHLETSLYPQAMNSSDSDFTFVLNNIPKFERAERLMSDFKNCLGTMLAGIMAKAGIQEPRTRVVDGWADCAEKWVVRCYSSAWGDSNIAFFFGDEGGQSGFFVTAYMCYLTADQNQSANQSFSKTGSIKYWTETGGRWSCWRNAQPLKDFATASSIFEVFTRIQNDVIVPLTSARSVVSTPQ